MPADHRRHASSGPERASVDVVVICGVVALVAAVLTGLAWSRPASTTEDVHYTQSGQLSYRAPVDPGSVYGTDGVSTGEPVYTSAVHTLNVTYAYRFSAAVPASLHGTEQLVAKMDNGAGITRTLPIQPPTTFTGTHFDATGTLDLGALELVANAFSQAAGGGAQTTYTVDVVPSVHAHGMVDGTPLHTTFDKPVVFSLTSSSLTPSPSSPTQASGAAQSDSNGSGGNQLNPQTTGSVSVPGGKPAAFLLGIGVAQVRVVALVVFLGALAGLVLLGRRLLAQVTSDDEAVRIAARYGSSLVETAVLPCQPGVVSVDLATFEGLMQVARRLECPVLHQRVGVGIDEYAVIDNGTLYRYATGPVAEPVPRSAPNGSAPAPLPEIVSSHGFDASPT